MFTFTISFTRFFSLFCLRSSIDATSFGFRFEQQAIEEEIEDREEEEEEDGGGEEKYKRWVRACHAQRHSDTTSKFFGSKLVFN